MAVMILACVREAFLLLLGAGPDCITGPVTRINCDVYHGGHSQIMAYLWRAFLLYNSQRDHAQRTLMGDKMFASDTNINNSLICK